MIGELTDERGVTTACLKEAAQARDSMIALGATETPQWADCTQVLTPPQPAYDSDAAFFERGWQGYVCSVVENHHTETVIKPSCGRAQRA
eukprot:6656591-Karenia_brevis.AAC.1